MSGEIRFDDTLARPFRAKAFVRAEYIASGPATYQVGWSPDGLQTMTGPHWRIVKLDEDRQPMEGVPPYGCNDCDGAPESYVLVEGDVYRKDAIVHAYPAPREGFLVTVIGGGVESVQPVHEGQPLVKNPKGEVYAVGSISEFERSYDPVEEWASDIERGAWEQECNALGRTDAGRPISAVEWKQRALAAEARADAAEARVADIPDAVVNEMWWLRAVRVQAAAVVDADGQWSLALVAYLKSPTPETERRLESIKAGRAASMERLREALKAEVLRG